MFYDRLKAAMVQRKWLAVNAPSVLEPDAGSSIDNGSMLLDAASGISIERPKSTSAGIAGLEQRGLQTRKKNEMVIGSAFEDLEALMASAKEIVALAERFAAEVRNDPTNDSASGESLLSESTAALGMVTTRDMLGEGADSLYISELSRNIAEYVTDEQRGILGRQGGIMSLVDLWALFNKSRNGVELISPSDFHKATQKWEQLGLPVRLRRFKSGLLAVQRYDWNDQSVMNQLRTWLVEMKNIPPEIELTWDWARFGYGVTAQDAVQRFGWSLGVAVEELEMAEEKGLLCREESVEGLKFWLNAIIENESE